MTTTKHQRVFAYTFPAKHQRVFAYTFPASTRETLCLLRRRLGLSRELVDDVMRARGYILYTPQTDVRDHQEWSFFEEKPHGHLRHWYSDNNDVLYSDSTYYEGNIHGISRFWYDNGARQCEIMYVKGVQQGMARGWHRNNMRHWEVMHVKGKRHGLGRKWRKDGTLKCEKRFDDDREVHVVHH